MSPRYQNAASHHAQQVHYAAHNTVNDRKRECTGFSDLGNALSKVCDCARVCSIACATDHATCAFTQARYALGSTPLAKCVFLRLLCQFCDVDLQYLVLLGLRF
jgi:hypothetical protein